MFKRKNLLIVALSIGMLASSSLVANAWLSLAIMGDRYLKKQAKIALNTPGHATWCSKKHRGYRKEWNTYPRGDGRVRYCASPFYTPPWKKWGAKK